MMMMSSNSLINWRVLAQNFHRGAVAACRLVEPTLGAERRAPARPARAAVVVALKNNNNSNSQLNSQPVHVEGLGMLETRARALRHRIR